MIGAVYRGLLDLLFPSFCALCGSFLFLDHKAVTCRDCWERGFKRYEGKKCSVCGHPLELLPASGDFCLRCFKERRSFPFDGVFYYALYRGLPEVAIRELKFGKYRLVARHLGEEISSHLKEVISQVGAHLVVPVPLHRSTLKERGFNQTEEILRWAQVEFTPLLEKPFKGKKQSAVCLLERRKNVKGLFRVKEAYRSLLKGKRVLLFDDVFTTGATAAELSELLKREGAEGVFVYTVAYTPLEKENAGHLVARG